jgi:cytochrome c556
MRHRKFAAFAVWGLLAACGGPETSQANNSAANISNDQRVANSAVPATATTNNAMVMLAVAPPKVNVGAVMHARHEGMETIGKNFKALHREFDSSSPFVPTVKSGAAQIASLAKQSSGWFAPGTGAEAGKTGAKPDIWQPQNKADFAAKLSAFQKAAALFNAAAASGDMAAAKARFADLGGSCKACHDKYRTEMKH